MSSSRRALVLLLVFVATALAGWQATKLRFDTSLEVYFVETDKDLAAYHDFLDVFSTDQVVVVAWRDDALWTPEGFATLRRVTEEIEALPDVRDARSLANASRVEAAPGSLSVQPLYDPDRKSVV